MSHNCRFCGAPVTTSFVDLGMSPISNDFVDAGAATGMEPFYPLHAFVCDNCLLVQLLYFNRSDDMFTGEYKYFSSYSQSWLNHCRAYAEATVARERLGAGSLVVEVASNDGYLLQFFDRLGVPVLGVEPTANTARVALDQHGIPSEVTFFGRESARTIVERHGRADLMAANNVLAHVPDINDFVAGFGIVLADGGVANFEFPHLLRQIEQHQFDTIYHEHFSYLSLAVARRIFAAHGLRVYDVEELPTHGGSLRLYVCHDGNADRPDTSSVAAMLAREAAAGLEDPATYRAFAEEAVRIKCDLLEFLIDARRRGKTVVGYGAPAKGNTLLNFCGIRTDLVAFTVDRSPHKVGKLLPGVRIPIRPVEAIDEEQPDYLLILPWNLKDEIITQMGHVREWGGCFVVSTPRLQIIE